MRKKERRSGERGGRKRGESTNEGRDCSKTTMRDRGIGNED